MQLKYMKSKFTIKDNVLGLNRIYTNQANFNWVDSIIFNNLHCSNVKKKNYLEDLHVITLLYVCIWGWGWDVETLQKVRSHFVNRPT